MWLVWKKTPKQSAGELLSRYLRAFIIWPSTIDTEQTRFASCVSQTELKGNMYTLKKTIEKHRNPFDIAHQTPRENASHHIKERRKKIGENIWSHVRMRDIILMYKTHRHFSTHPEKNTKKGQKKSLCILLHREALSVIRCVLLQAYSHWYFATEWREKRSALSSNGICIMYTGNT